MARNFVILSLLLLVAVVGLASAQSAADAPATTPLPITPDVAASSPDTIGSIGNDDDLAPSDDAVEAPVGAPVDASAFKPVEAASAPTSGATMVKHSAAGLVLAVAGYFF